MPYFSVKASASSADSGAVPHLPRGCFPGRSRQVSVQHRPQRGGYQDTVPGGAGAPPSTTRRARIARAAQRVSPLTHWSTPKTPPRCTSGEFTIATPRRSSIAQVCRRVRGPPPSVRASRTRGRPVWAVRSSRWSACARRPGPAVGRRSVRTGPASRRTAPRATPSGPRGHQPRQIDRFADDGEAERGDVGAVAVVATGRIDGHDRPPARSTPRNAAT